MQDLERALRTNNSAAVMSLFPKDWGSLSLPKKVRKADDIITASQITGQAGETAAQRLERVLSVMLDGAATAESQRLKRMLGANAKVRWNILNRYSIDFLQGHAAQLIQGLQGESEQAITSILVHGFENGVPVKDMARQIRDTIGLNTRQAEALRNRRAQLEASGMDPTEVNRKADAYAGRLLRERGELIARTETITAQAAGQRDAWKVAQDDGLLPKDIKRRWIEAGASVRTCKICRAFGALDPVGLDEPFIAIVDGRRYEAMLPPGHPACRCSTGIAI